MHDPMAGPANTVGGEAFWFLGGQARVRRGLLRGCTRVRRRLGRGRQGSETERQADNEAGEPARCGGHDALHEPDVRKGGRRPRTSLRRR